MHKQNISCIDKACWARGQWIQPAEPQALIQRVDNVSRYEESLARHAKNAFEHVANHLRVPTMFVYASRNDGRPLVNGWLHV